MSRITTHVLDTAHGTPAQGVAIDLYRAVGDSDWERVGGGISNSDGRVPDLLPEELTLPAGRYRMHFATGAYLEGRGVAVFYPYVDVVFELDDSGAHYHVPLLLAPYGYSTYRGS